MNAPNLAELWTITRLNEHDVRPRRSASPPQSDRLLTLQSIVKVGCGYSNHEYWSKASGCIVRGRTVPSAGALYPFDVVVVDGGRAERGTIRSFDVSTGLLVGGTSTSCTMGDLANHGVYVPPEGPCALIVVLARPWRAMQRYQMRGYFYSHLDAGHAAANITRYAQLIGQNPVLAVHIDRSGLIRELGLEGFCCEPVAVITVAPNGLISRREAPSTQENSVGLERPSEEEIDCFGLLRDMGCFSEPAPQKLVVQEIEHSQPDEDTRVVNGECTLLECGSDSASLQQFLKLVWQRRSAKVFRDEPLSISQLGGILSAVRGGYLYRRDPNVNLRVSIRLVARHVEGLHGAYGFSSSNFALRKIADSDELDFVTACMHQECVVNAAMLLIVHARAGGLVAEGRYSALSELHVRAANVGQLIYLAGTEYDVGVTCIGSFDTNVCRRIAGLTDDDTVLYLLALGVPSEAGGKLDRENTASLEAYTKIESLRS